MDIERTKNGGNPTAKIIAAILLVISFVMLFLPWMTLSVKIMGQKVTIPDILRSAQVTSSDVYEYVDDLISTYYLYYENINVDSSVKAIEGIADSAATPLDTARFSTWLHKVFSAIKDPARDTISEYNSEDSYDSFLEDGTSYQAIGKAVTATSVASIAMWVLMICNVIAAAIALILIFKGSKTGTIIYACISAALLVTFAVIIGKLNHISYSVSALIGQIFGEFFESDAYNIKIAHIGAPAILSVIFAALAFGVQIYCEKTGALAGAGAFSHARSQARYCPVCGAKLKADDVFCPRCGQRYPAGRVYAQQAQSSPYVRPQSEGQRNYYWQPNMQSAQRGNQAQQPRRQAAQPRPQPQAAQQPQRQANAAGREVRYRQLLEMGAITRSEYEDLVKKAGRQ